MSDILKRTKRIEQIGGNHARVLLHGSPGSGKTSEAATMAQHGKTLYLYTRGEEGINSLRGIKGAENLDLVLLESLADLTELFRIFVKGDHPYETVVVDTVSALQQMWGDELLKKGGFSVKRSQATKDFDYWGALKEGMEEFFTFWYGLADHGRENPIHVVMTAQTEEKEYNGETKFVPLLQGKAWKTLLARPDHIFFCHMEEDEADADKYRHVMRVKPSADVYAKLRVNPEIGAKIPDIMGRKGQVSLPDFLSKIGTGGFSKPAKKATTKKAAAPKQ